MGVPLSRVVFPYALVWSRVNLQSCNTNGKFTGRRKKERERERTGRWCKTMIWTSRYHQATIAIQQLSIVTRVASNRGNNTCGRYDTAALASASVLSLLSYFHYLRYVPGALSHTASPLPPPPRRLGYDQLRGIRNDLRQRTTKGERVRAP